MPTESEHDRPVDVVICPAGAAENVPRQDFCARCGGPLTEFAVTDPLKSIYAQGWAYRRASSSRVPVIVLLGMWAILAPAVVIVVVGVIEWARTPAYMRSDNGPLSFALTFGFCALCTIVVWRVTRNYVRHRRAERWQAAGLCGTCGYDLRAWTVPRCPECVTPFGPDDLGYAGDP